MIYFENEMQLAQWVQLKGGTLYIVGGAVRDSLMGKPESAYSDRDYVVTGWDEDEVAANFGEPVGASFPVYLVHVGDQKVEVALARTEIKTGEGHKGFTCVSSKKLSIIDDLARRDLTMNAIARKVLSREVMDPFGGKRDIEAYLIRHVSDAFKEDPLRVFRVARFAARFRFSVASETLALMRTMREDLRSLSAERVWKETEKVLADENANPRTYFDILRLAGVLDVWFPEIAQLDVPDMHDGTAYEHTMRLLSFPSSLKIRFGLLCHDLGKGTTPKDILPRHHDHDERGVAVVESMCERLRVPNKLMFFGMKCSSTHMRIKIADKMRAGKFVRFVLQNEHDWDDLVTVSAYDSMNREGCEVDDYIAADVYFRDTLTRMKNNVLAAKKSCTGKTLIAEGYEQNKNFGDILFQRRVSLYRALCRTWAYES